MSERYIAVGRPGHGVVALPRLRPRRARIVSVSQIEHQPPLSRGPGYVEHDPEEIWRNVPEVVRGGARRGVSSTVRDLVGLGITNQRETTVLWDRATGDAGAQRDHLAGHAHGPAGARARRRRRAPTASATAAGCRSPRTSRGRRSAGCSTTSPGLRERAEAGEVLLRDDGLVADLEAYRPPPDRRDERRPDDADEPRDARLGRRPARRDGRAAGDAARDPALDGGLRRGAAASSPGCRWRPRWATSTRRCSGRRASTPATRSAPTAPAASCS